MHNSSRSVVPDYFESQQVQPRVGTDSAPSRGFPLDSLEERSSMTILGQWNRVQHYENVHLMWGFGPNVASIH